MPCKIKIIRELNIGYVYKFMNHISVIVMDKTRRIDFDFPYNRGEETKLADSEYSLLKCENDNSVVIDSTVSLSKIEKSTKRT